MLSPAEREQVLFDWKQTAAIVAQTCLYQSVEAAARAYPSTPAIVCNGAILTYGELMARASQLVSYLRRGGIGEGSIVALYLPRSPDLIVAQMAVLGTGAAYVALDRSYPLERKRLVIEDARPVLIITLESLVEDLASEEPLLLMDAAAPRIAAVAAQSSSAGRLYSLAYVTCTSGSTGRPKGVLSHHRGAANYIAYMISARLLEPGERVLQFTSLSFNGSVRDTLGTLIFGGTIVLLDDKSARDPFALLTAIREERATLILCIVPTMLRALIRVALDEGRATPGMRLIMVGGEALLRDDVEKARQAFGTDLQIINQYGATECSMVAADYAVPAELPAGTTALPIGRPIANSRIYILDRELEPVTPGSEGDLYIGGVGVGLGYLNRPELTAERFLPDPHGVTPHGRMYRTGDLARHLPDGSIQYLGRADQQVKIKGNRVELGEIESVLLTHPAVRQAAVLLSRNAEREQLIAYVTKRGEAQSGELRAFLAARLPLSMIPSSFVVLDDMPFTQSGKVDRKRLPNPDDDRAKRTIIPARSRAEVRLVSIWESVLGMRQIGVEEDFFDLGGDSLRAAELFARIEHEFGRALPSSTLFQHGTVESLAKLLEKENARPRPGVVALQPHGARTPLFLVTPYLYLRELARGFAPERPVYALEAEAPFTTPIMIEARVHYENLIAFRPDGPYMLAGHSAGGYIALETARLLIRNGKRVAFLGLFDTFPPGPREQAAPLERVRLHLVNLSGRKPREALGLLIQSAKRRMLRALGYLPGRRRLVSVLARAGAEQWVGRLIVQSYFPEPFSGDVTLFVVGERPWYIRWDPMERWSRYLAGRTEIVPIEGDHLSSIREPLASELARKVESLLP